jgi:hypothetical protein
MGSIRSKNPFDALNTRTEFTVSAFMFQVHPVSKKQLQMVDVNSFWPCKEYELSNRRSFRRLLWYGRVLWIHRQGFALTRVACVLPAGPAERWGPIYSERSCHFNLFHFQIYFKLPWLRKRGYVFINTISKTIFHSSIIIISNIPSPHHHSTPETQATGNNIKTDLNGIWRKDADCSLPNGLRTGFFEHGMNLWVP